MKFCPIEYPYKSKIGGVSAGEELTFTILGSAQSADLVLTKEGEGHFPVHYKMDAVEGGFKVTVTIMTSGLYFYHFLIDGRRFASDELLNLIEGGNDYLQLVYEGAFRSLDGVIYQIMPDRFNVGGPMIKSKQGVTYNEDIYSTPNWQPDARGEYNTEFYGGNLCGITQKLDYLASLGVTYIYLNPIFASPSSHRYDTSDYEKIDELLGTEDDLKELITEARGRGMGLILDGVFSHTGADSKYFDLYGRYGETGAYRSKSSKYYSWYKFEDYPDKYKSWWGFKTLPEVNETDPSYMEYILGKGGIVEKWESLGIAGWRLDVADELPDEFLFGLRKASHGVLIGEVWENAARKFAYGARRKYFLGGQLDGVTNYPLRAAVIDFIRSGNNLSLRRALREQINDYPSGAAVMNILGTHDTVRILTALSSDETPRDKAGKASFVQSDLEQASRRLKIALLIQFLLPGVPCIYYGDEAGLFGHEDPFCRKCYPFGKENKELIGHYAFLGKLRRDYREILRGETRDLSPDENTFVLFRGTKAASLELKATSESAELSLNGRKIFAL